MRREVDLSQTTKLAAGECPYCQNRLSGHTGPAKPEPGDMSVCGLCGGYLKFDDGMRLRALTPADHVELTNNPEVAKMLGVLRDMVTKHRKVH